MRLAVVQELQRGNDGLVRSAIIRTDRGITNRPIIKLYPLEVNALPGKESHQDVTDNDDVHQEVLSHNWPLLRPGQELLSGELLSGLKSCRARRMSRTDRI